MCCPDYRCLSDPQTYILVRLSCGAEKRMEYYFCYEERG